MNSASLERTQSPVSGFCYAQMENAPQCFRHLVAVTDATRLPRNTGLVTTVKDNEVLPLYSSCINETTVAVSCMT